MRAKALLLAALAFGFSGATHAAEIFASVSLGAIQIYGPIEEGDAQKVRAKILEMNEKGVVLSRVLLTSPGGSVEEAIDIGRMMRDAAVYTSGPTDEVEEIGGEWVRYLRCGAKLTGEADAFVSSRKALQVEENAIVDANCICASACALIWLGGVERSGTVAFHRSYFKGVPDNMSFKEFSDGLGASHQAIIAYMEEMRTPKGIAESMISTPSTDLYWVEDHKIRELGLDADRLFSEFLYARCPDPLSPEEREMSVQLELIDRTGHVWNFKDPTSGPKRAAPLGKAEKDLLEHFRSLTEVWNSCLTSVKLSIREEAQLE